MRLLEKRLIATLFNVDDYFVGSAVAVHAADEGLHG